VLEKIIGGEQHAGPDRASDGPAASVGKPEGSVSPVSLRIVEQREINKSSIISKKKREVK